MSQGGRSRRKKSFHQRKVGMDAGRAWISNISLMLDTAWELPVYYYSS